MIGYRLDTRSGVAPYLQLVQQTKDALRLGLLHPGDQLPTVKEVVGAIAINPNTVLKAYRELEHEGLVQGRPGVGTFVLKGFGGPRLSDSPHLRRRLARWLADAQGVSSRGGNSVTAAIETAALSKRYRRTWALRDCSLSLPAGRVAALVGPNGAGKTTLLHLVVGLLAPTSWRVSGSSRRTCRCTGGSASGRCSSSDAG